MFVYGTLKSDQRNVDKIQNEARGYSKLICRGQTVHKYPLVEATKYNVAFVLWKEGEGKVILYIVGNVADNTFMVCYFSSIYKEKFGS